MYRVSQINMHDFIILSYYKLLLGEYLLPPYQKTLFKSMQCYCHEIKLQKGYLYAEKQKKLIKYLCKFFFSEKSGYIVFADSVYTSSI